MLSFGTIRLSLMYKKTNKEFFLLDLYFSGNPQVRLATPGATVLKAANPQSGKQQIIVQKPGGAPGSQQIVTLVMTSQEMPATSVYLFFTYNPILIIIKIIISMKNKMIQGLFACVTPSEYIQIIERAWEVAPLRIVARYYPMKRKGVEKQIQNVTNILIMISDFFRNCLIASYIGHQAGAS